MQTADDDDTLSSTTQRQHLGPLGMSSGTAAIERLLAAHYGLDVRSSRMFDEGLETAKLLIDAGRRYLVKIHPTSNADAVVFSTRVALALARRGYPWVVPPLPNSRGEPYTLLEHFVVEVRAYVDATPLDEAAVTPQVLGQFGTMFGQLHREGSSLVTGLELSDDDGPVAGRLERVLTSAASIGPSDPRSATARLIVSRRQGLVEDARVVDERRRDVDAARARWTVTHGDASPANILVDAYGQPRLIDWTSACWAPPERDLVHYLAQGALEFMPAYERAANPVGLQLDVVDYYLRRWLVDGIIEFGSRCFADPPGPFDAGLDVALRYFAADHSENHRAALAVARTYSTER